MDIQENKTISLARFFIFVRAALIVMFTTSNIYLISDEKYMLSIVFSAVISLMWTLNIKDLAISCWKDRTSYILGSIAGTTISLYILNGLI